jgi:hypothetical protein
MKYLFTLLLIWYLIPLSAQVPFTFNPIYKVYGNEPFPLTYYIETNGSMEGISFEELDEDDCIAISGNMLTIKKAGSAKIKATRATTEQIAKISIAKKYIRVSASDTFCLYGEKIQEYKVTSHDEDFANDDTWDDLDLPPRASCVATISSNAGRYPITITDGYDENYDFLIENGTLEIRKRNLRVQPESAEKFYGEPLPSISLYFYPDDFVGSDNWTDLDELPVVYCDCDTFSPCAIYHTKLKGGFDNNYTYEKYQGTLMVKQASLKISIQDTFRYWGDENPAMTLKYEGLVGDDSLLDVLDTFPRYSHTAIITSEPEGVYNMIFDTKPIVKNSNYAITYSEPGGKLTIMKSPLSLDIHKLYKLTGQENPSLRFDYDRSQFKFNDSIWVLDFDTILTTRCTDTSHAGLYTIMFQPNPLDDHYQIIDNYDTLVVLDTISFQTGLTDSCCLGSSYDMESGITAIPTSIKWFFSLDGEPFTQYFDDSLRISGDTTSTLHFDSITSEYNSYLFRCTASQNFYHDSAFIGTVPDVMITKTSINRNVALKNTPPNFFIDRKGQHMLIWTETIVPPYPEAGSIEPITSFQWGFNGVDISQATKSYFYSEDLNMQSIENYYVKTGYANSCTSKSYYFNQILPEAMLTDKIEITVTPNPNRGSFALHLESLIKNINYEVSIWDFQGNLFYKNTYSSTESKTTIHIDIPTSAKSGLFILTVRQEDRTGGFIFTIKK